eukprot:g19127.t1
MGGNVDSKSKVAAGRAFRDLFVSDSDDKKLRSHNLIAQDLYRFLCAFVVRKINAALQVGVGVEVEQAKKKETAQTLLSTAVEMRDEQHTSVFSLPAFFHTYFGLLPKGVRRAVHEQRAAVRDPPTQTLAALKMSPSPVVSFRAPSGLFLRQPGPGDDSNEHLATICIEALAQEMGARVQQLGLAGDIRLQLHPEEDKKILVKDRFLNFLDEELHELHSECALMIQKIHRGRAVREEFRAVGEIFRKIRDLPQQLSGMKYKRVGDGGGSARSRDAEASLECVSYESLDEIRRDLDYCRELQDIAGDLKIFHVPNFHDIDTFVQRLTKVGGLFSKIDFLLESEERPIELWACLQRCEALRMVSQGKVKALREKWVNLSGQAGRLRKLKTLTRRAGKILKKVEERTAEVVDDDAGSSSSSPTAVETAAYARLRKEQLMTTGTSLVLSDEESQSGEQEGEDKEHSGTSRNHDHHRTTTTPKASNLGLGTTTTTAIRFQEVVVDLLRTRAEHITQLLKDIAHFARQVAVAGSGPTWTRLQSYDPEEAFRVLMQGAVRSLNDRKAALAELLEKEDLVLQQMKLLQLRGVESEDLEREEVFVGKITLLARLGGVARGEVHSLPSEARGDSEDGRAFKTTMTTRTDQTRWHPTTTFSSGTTSVRTNETVRSSGGSSSAVSYELPTSNYPAGPNDLIVGDHVDATAFHLSQQGIKHQVTTGAHTGLGSLDPILALAPYGGWGGGEASVGEMETPKENDGERTPGNKELAAGAGWTKRLHLPSLYAALKHELFSGNEEDHDLASDYAFMQAIDVERFWTRTSSGVSSTWTLAKGDLVKLTNSKLYRSELHKLEQEAKLAAAAGGAGGSVAVAAAATATSNEKQYAVFATSFLQRKTELAEKIFGAGVTEKSECSISVEYRKKPEDRVVVKLVRKTAQEHLQGGGAGVVVAVGEEIAPQASAAGRATTGAAPADVSMEKSPSNDVLPHQFSGQSAAQTATTTTSTNRCPRSDDKADKNNLASPASSRQRSARDSSVLLWESSSEDESDSDDDDDEGSSAYSCTTTPAAASASPGRTPEGRSRSRLSSTAKRVLLQERLLRAHDELDLGMIRKILERLHTKFAVNIDAEHADSLRLLASLQKEEVLRQKLKLTKEALQKKMERRRGGGFEGIKSKRARVVGEKTISAEGESSDYAGAAAEADDDDFANEQMNNQIRIESSSFNNISPRTSEVEEPFPPPPQGDESRPSASVPLPRMSVSRQKRLTQRLSVLEQSVADHTEQDMEALKRAQDDIAKLMNDLSAAVNIGGATATASEGDERHPESDGEFAISSEDPPRINMTSAANILPSEQTGVSTQQVASSDDRWHKLVDTTSATNSEEILSTRLSNLMSHAEGLGVILEDEKACIRVQQDLRMLMGDLDATMGALDFDGVGGAEAGGAPLEMDPHQVEGPSADRRRASLDDPGALILPRGRGHSVMSADTARSLSPSRQAADAEMSRWMTGLENRLMKENRASHEKALPAEEGRPTRDSDRRHPLRTTNYSSYEASMDSPVLGPAGAPAPGSNADLQAGQGVEDDHSSGATPRLTPAEQRRPPPQTTASPTTPHSTQQHYNVEELNLFSLRHFPNLREHPDLGLGWGTVYFESELWQHTPERLRHQTTPLDSPLCQFPTFKDRFGRRLDMDPVALDAFRVILRLSGSAPKSHYASLYKDLVEDCQQFRPLIDEVYLQILKQLSFCESSIAKKNLWFLLQKLLSHEYFERVWNGEVVGRDQFLEDELAYQLASGEASAVEAAVTKMSNGGNYGSTGSPTSNDALQTQELPTADLLRSASSVSEAVAQTAASKHWYKHFTRAYRFVPSKQLSPFVVAFFRRLIHFDEMRVDAVRCLRKLQAQFLLQISDDAKAELRFKVWLDWERRAKLREEMATSSKLSSSARRDRLADEGKFVRSPKNNLVASGDFTTGETHLLGEEDGRQTQTASFLAQAGRGTTGGPDRRLHQELLQSEMRRGDGNGNGTGTSNKLVLEQSLVFEEVDLSTPSDDHYIDDAVLVSLGWQPLENIFRHKTTRAVFAEKQAAERKFYEEKARRALARKKANENMLLTDQWRVGKGEDHRAAVVSEDRIRAKFNDLTTSPGGDPTPESERTRRSVLENRVEDEDDDDDARTLVGLGRVDPFGRTRSGPHQEVGKGAGLQTILEGDEGDEDDVAAIQHQDLDQFNEQGEDDGGFFSFFSSGSTSSIDQSRLERARNYWARRRTGGDYDEKPGAF